MRYDTLFSGGRARRGFTLTEMIIATTMLGLFGASAITFYLHSLHAVANTSGRNDAQQTASFALDFVDHDLRIAGTNLAPNQPLMLVAHPSFIMFNGDLITHDTSASAGGTYFDQSVPDTTALVWQASRAQNIQGTAIAYPDSTYYADAPSNTVLGEAETVQFWVKADSSQPGSQLYILWRQVNDNAPVAVAKNIYSTTANPPVVFTYYYENQTTNQLVQFPSTSIPVYHTPTNPATQARLDSIREVRVTFTGAYTDPQNRGHSVYRTVNEVIRLPNAYMSRVSQCPGPIHAIGGLTPAPSTAGQDTVGLTWSKAPDDGQGLNTARMYLIYRKKHTDTTYVQINQVNASGAAGYAYRDAAATGILLDSAYDYGISVRDCTPSMSPMTTTTNVIPQ